MEATITGPGSWHATNGWSSHPPARSTRYGIRHVARSWVVDRRGSPGAGLRFRMQYWTPSLLHKSALLEWWPSSLTNNTLGFRSTSSCSKSRIPLPREMNACFTQRSYLIIKIRSSSTYSGGVPLICWIVRSDPIATYKSPNSAADVRKATWPLWSKSKQPLTITLGMITPGAHVLVHRELEFCRFEIIEWWTTPSRGDRGVLVRKLITLMPIPKGRELVHGLNRPPFGFGSGRWRSGRFSPSRYPPRSPSVLITCGTSGNLPFRLTPIPWPIVYTKPHFLRCLEQNHIKSNLALVGRDFSWHKPILLHIHLHFHRCMHCEAVSCHDSQQS